MSLWMNFDIKKKKKKKQKSSSSKLAFNFGP